MSLGWALKAIRNIIIPKQIFNVVLFGYDRLKWC